MSHRFTAQWEQQNGLSYDFQDLVGVTRDNLWLIFYQEKNGAPATQGLSQKGSGDS